MDSPQSLPIVGAARAYLAKRFGGLFTERETISALSAVASAPVANAPDRLGLLVVNLSANNVFASLSPAPSASNGILIAPNGGTLSLNVDEDFTLTTRQFNLVAPAGASNIYVLEMLREIRTGEPLEFSP